MICSTSFLVNMRFKSAISRDPSIETPRWRTAPQDEGDERRKKTLLILRSAPKARVSKDASPLLHSHARASTARTCGAFACVYIDWRVSGSAIMRSIAARARIEISGSIRISCCMVCRDLRIFGSVIFFI